MEFVQRRITNRIKVFGEEICSSTNKRHLYSILSNKKDEENISHIDDTLCKL